MRALLAIGAATALLVLAACGQNTACYGLSDAAAVAKVMHNYAALPAIDRADPAQTRFSRARVMGIGRNAEAAKSGKALTQVWFAQDDNTVTVATLLEDCRLSVRPNLTPDAIRQAAISVKPARF